MRYSSPNDTRQLTRFGQYVLFGGVLIALIAIGLIPVTYLGLAVAGGIMFSGLMLITAGKCMSQTQHPKQNKSIEYQSNRAMNQMCTKLLKRQIYADEIKNKKEAAHKSASVAKPTATSQQTNFLQRFCQFFHFNNQIKLPAQPNQPVTNNIVVNKI